MGLKNNTEFLSASLYANDDESRIAAEACTNAQGRGFQVAFPYENGRSLGYSATLPNGGLFVRTLGRDPHRLGLVTSCTNLFNGTVLTAFGYDYDALGRRVSRNDDSFDYNARSELTSALLGSDAYGYGYDGIGNFVFSAACAVTNVYTANGLNQYTSDRAVSC
jgi:hypothetical protein